MQSKNSEQLCPKCQTEYDSYILDNKSPFCPYIHCHNKTSCIMFKPLMKKENTELSLKAKGLLSLMLSLPKNWNYTTKGLAAICKDGIDSISTCIKELEKHGYIIRERVRNEKGQLTTIEYTILE